MSTTKTNIRHFFFTGVVKNGVNRVKHLEAGKFIGALLPADGRGHRDSEIYTCRVTVDTDAKTATTTAIPGDDIAYVGPIVDAVAVYLHMDLVWSWNGVNLRARAGGTPTSHSQYGGRPSDPNNVRYKLDLLFRVAKMPTVEGDTRLIRWLLTYVELSSHCDIADKRVGDALGVLKSCGYTSEMAKDPTSRLRSLLGEFVNRLETGTAFDSSFLDELNGLL